MTVLSLALACHSPDPGHSRPDDSGTPPAPSSGETGASTGETGDSGPPAPPVFEVSLTVDPDMVLMVHAAFDDLGADDSWVEYRFETDDWLVAPVIAPGDAVILGLPELTSVEARAAVVVGGVTSYSEPASITTGPLPSALLRPTVHAFDSDAASPENYMMVSVSAGNFTFEGPWVLQIFDRTGRVVWYHVVPDELFSLYASVAFSGTHIWYDAEDIFGFSGGDPHVRRQTLDGRWFVELDAPGAGQAFAEGPDGSFFYELRSGKHGVVQLDAAGGTELVWDCDEAMDDIGMSGGDCLLNGCNWSEARNSLLASQFETGTVFEVDLATGLAVRQMGQIESGDPFAFDPVDSMFAYQHWPHFTPEGTLFVSTHLPCGSQGGCNDTTGRDGVQVAAEYAIDDATHTLTRIWSHESTDRWATQAGEAYRLPNGNVIQGYGQDGAVREIGPDGATVFDVDWPGDGSGYRAIGHAALISDLYALNVGE